jgi:FHA domain
MTVLYRAGHGVLIVGRTALIHMHGSAARAIGDAQIRELHDIVKAGRPMMHAMDILVRDGFRAMAPCVLAESVNGRLRVIVHGDLTVEVATAEDQTRTLTSHGFATLAESVIEGAIGVRVASDSAGSWLPLEAGAVLASGFEWTFDNEPVAAWPIEKSDLISEAAAGGRAEVRPVVEPHRDDFVVVPVPSAPVVGTGPGEDRARPAAATTDARSTQQIGSASDTSATFVGDLDEGGYDHLWESTVMRSVEDAAIRPPQEDATEPTVSPMASVAQPLTAVPDFRRPPPGAVQTVPTRLGDHDGSTIMDANLGRRLRASRAPVAGRVQLRISTGQVVFLERSVVLGRQPSVSRVSVQDMPTLVVVPSQQMDISRNHLEVRQSGEQVVVVDLKSTNGSTIIRPDGSRQPLARGGQLPVEIGDVIDLGDSVTVTIEATP